MSHHCGWDVVRMVKVSNKQRRSPISNLGRDVSPILAMRTLENIWRYITMRKSVTLMLILVMTLTIGISVQAQVEELVIWNEVNVNPILSARDEYVLLKSG